MRRRTFFLCGLLLVFCGQNGSPLSPAARQGTKKTTLLVELFPASPLAMLVGGVRDGKWIPQEKAALSSVRGVRFRFYSLQGLAGETTTGGIERSETGSEQHYLSLQKPIRHPEILLGIAADWNPMPRPVVPQSTDQEVYRQAVRDVLRRKGMPSAPVRITQILRVDLEGSGEPSVVLTAEYPQLRSDVAKPKGAYSFVMVRQVVRGSVKTVLLDGSFMARYPSPDTLLTSRSTYQVTGILDVDGDGRMEVVVHGDFYEANSAQVYTVRNGIAKRVLETGDGV